jgi:hypothetical protein
MRRSYCGENKGRIREGSSTRGPAPSKLPLDNSSSHRGQAPIERLQAAHPRIIPVHGPVHASWLNQIEIYFPIVQRKVLTPINFSSLQEVQDRLFRFQRYYETIARPFEWKFTRADLDEMMNRMKPAANQLRPSGLVDTLPYL